MDKEKALISCIILSAGLSSRFGSPKALALFKDHQTVIQYLLEQLLKTKLNEIIVVLGAHAHDIKPFLLNHKKIKVVYNKDYNLGQTSSVKSGLKQISPNTKAFLVLPVDYPWVNPKTIDGLIRHFLNHKSLVLIPSYQDKKGHPPLFDIDLKDEFLNMENTLGINEIAKKYSNETMLADMDDAGVIKTFNTKEEFEQLK